MLRNVSSGLSVNVPISNPEVAIEAAAPASAPAPSAYVPAADEPMDDVSQRVVAVSPNRPLPNVLWGEVGKFSARRDVLNLRRASRMMAGAVDRSVTSLCVNADKAAAMLAAVGKSSNLKHINTLRIECLTNANAHPVMRALAALPLSHVNLEITRAPWLSPILNEMGFTLLRTITPASLRIINEAVITSGEAGILAGLNYPIALIARQYHAQDEANLRALTTIRHLVSLNIRSEVFSDELAALFAGHPTLQEMCLQGSGYHWHGTIDISNAAVAALATMPTLRTLTIGPTRHPLGAQAIAALAASQTLEHLRLDTPYEPLEDSVGMMLSENRSLKTLQLILERGFGHLSGITSLETLRSTDAGSTISLEDAREFAKRAHLKKLHIGQATFEAGAFAELATAAVEHLSLSVARLSAEDLQALLANQTLRSLDLSLSSDRTSTVAQVIALAGHSTLESLRVVHADPYSLSEGSVVSMSSIERMALRAAWGEHRPAAAVRVDFF